MENNNIKSVRIASKNHSINEVESDNFDAPSPTSHPFWEAATILTMICDPTKAIDTERIQNSLGWLETHINDIFDYKLVFDDYAAKSVVYKQLWERFLGLAGGNQANPREAKEYLRLATEARKQYEYCSRETRTWKHYYLEQQKEKRRMAQQSR